MSGQINGIEIPFLPEKKKYRVILRLPDYSFTKGLFTVFSGSIPKLVLPTLCICCNKETTDTKQVMPFDDDRKLKEPMVVPVCETCKKHAFTDAGSTSLYLLPIMLGLVGTIAMLYQLFSAKEIYNKNTFVVLLAISIAFLAGGIYLAYRYSKRFKFAEHGHSPETEFDSRIDGELFILTINKTLVENIIKYNPGTIFKVSTTADPEPFLK
ncbi:MAG: hypothetical protein K0S32_4100 [Bacteroidetes bacterium]|jgi:hypothetical protein|nr:hypothetical protein [Bacteroidota bacterium]